MFYIFDTEEHKESIDTLLRVFSATTWNSLSNEFGRIALFVEHIKGTDVIDLIPRSEVPFDHVVMYYNTVCDYRQNNQNNI